MRKGKFLVRKSESSDEWFFTLRAGNGKVIAQSEMYSSKAKALKGIKAVIANAATAKIIEED